MSVASFSGQWADQFTRPSIEDLFAGLNKADQTLAQRCLDRFAHAGARVRTVQWHGIPWNWTIAIKSDNDTPLAFLIPEPRKPQLALRLPAAHFTGVSLRKVSKPIREGLLAAKVVNGIVWPEWQLVSKSQVDELLALVELKPVATRDF